VAKVKRPVSTNPNVLSGSFDPVDPAPAYLKFKQLIHQANYGPNPPRMDEIRKALQDLIAAVTRAR
jgi:hypothetical protein